MILQSANWLILQCVWIVLAILMNLYSYILVLLGAPRLTSTEPLAGITIFLCYAPFVWLGSRRWRRTYLTATVVFIALIFASGILKHLAAWYQPNGLQAYSSHFWWAVAILLNAYGVTVSIIAMIKLPQSKSI